MNHIELIKVNLEGNYTSRLKEAYEKVDSIVSKLNNKGYKVVTITPLTGSENYYDDTENKSYGYGFSFTIGLLVVFEEISTD